ncbi:hypothetical protein JTE90_005310 [Oedothorax gibbosus]|uniref:Uncharacterized protein n=1 Tax=Oedothorax gibbosus TaxID=931172 RepID=A0AAV6UI48_9ARAC|nr:hypothetical protein JTE90_005310 [Oedothorax gibbosus]
MALSKYLAYILLEEEENDDAEFIFRKLFTNREEDCMFQRRRVEGAFENLVKRHLFGNDTKFKEYFRLSINLFQEVLALIEGDVAARPCNRRRQPISVEEKLCLTLG